MSVDEKDEPDTSWIPAREALVQQALDQGDYEALRSISALPGGFGGDDMRRKVWPVLLRTAQYFPSDGETSRAGEGFDLHRDEAQVKLDTDRSFVSYPVGIPAAKKQAMQDDLEHLIVGTLRAYPQLNYFQGYHDIMSVLYLTVMDSATVSESSGRRSRKGPRRRQSPEGDLPAEKDGPHNLLQTRQSSNLRNGREWRELRECAAAVSVFRLRDAMGKGMDGMMGWLKILKRILRTSDPDLARFSNVISPVPTLPFFALSWILCLFSHDIDTLEPVQRMFDFLLARNPVAALYLAVAILVIKKPQMYALAKKLGSEASDDPSLLHPLFARLPPLEADTPTRLHATPAGESQPSQDDSPNPYEPIRLSELFALTDSLIAKYPWDGDQIRGNDILGAGSVVSTYSQEGLAGEQAFTPEQALALIDVDVVCAGATEVDPEDEPAATMPPARPRRRSLRLRVPINRLGTLVAVGILVVGIGLAAYGPRRTGQMASTGSYWAAMARRWAWRVRREVLQRIRNL